MNDWPIQGELDTRLRKLIDREVESARATGGALRGPVDRAGVSTTRGLVVLAFVAVLAVAGTFLIYPRVLGPGLSPEVSGPSGGTTSPTALTSLPPFETPTSQYQLECDRQFNGSAVMNDGRVLIVGECTNAGDARIGDVFDPATGGFRRTQPATEPFGRPFVTAHSDGKVLIVDWQAPANRRTVQIYDPSTNEFARSRTTLPMSASILALRDGRILVIDQGSKSAQLYDPELDKLTQTGPSLGYDIRGSGLLADGRVYFLGNDGSQIYDPASGKFSAARKLPATLNYAPSTSLPDGRVLVFDGDCCGNLEPGIGPTIWDPVADTYTSASAMVVSTRILALVPLADGRVLLLGPKPAGTRATEGKTRAFGSATFALADAFIRPEPDSGEPFGNGVTGSALVAQIYDPVSGRFALTASPLIARVYFTANLLQDGRVLVAGGGPTNTAELYDPTTRRWQMVAAG